MVCVCPSLPLSFLGLTALDYNVRLKRTGKRNEIFIATKFGFSRAPDRLVDGRPEYAAQQIERSLKRLGVDCIDLYYLHRCACQPYETASLLMSRRRPDVEVPIEVCIVYAVN